MSKLIDGKYTVGMPFASGIQYITSDEIIESDTHQTLSTALNTIQGGTFQNGTFTGHLTFGDASGDNITINAGSTAYVNNETITLKDNSSTSLVVSSTGNDNMLVVNTTNGGETITMNKKLQLVNTVQGSNIMSIQTTNTTWNYENFYGILLMRPSVGTVFSITSPDYNNSCLYLSAADLGPMMEVMDSVNSILKIGDSTFGATSIMEIHGKNPVITTTIDSSSITDTNCFNCLGGMTIRKKLYVGTGIYLPTAGGTAAQLNYYETTTTHTMRFQSFGGGGSTADVSLKLARIGNMIMIMIPSFTIDSNGSWIDANTSYYLPSRFFPTSTVNSTCHSISINSWLDTGNLVITNLGRIYLQKSIPNPNFGVGTGSGLNGSLSLSYLG